MKLNTSIQLPRSYLEKRYVNIGFLNLNIQACCIAEEIYLYSKATMIPFVCGFDLVNKIETKPLNAPSNVKVNLNQS